MNDGTFRHTRVFSAPRELVFRCMLTPEHLTQFWGPGGLSAPLDGITLDPRPGGLFETVMVADDGTHRSLDKLETYLRTLTAASA